MAKITIPADTCQIIHFLLSLSPVYSVFTMITNKQVFIVCHILILAISYQLLVCKQKNGARFVNVIKNCEFCISFITLQVTFKYTCNWSTIGYTLMKHCKRQKWKIEFEKFQLKS